MVNTLVLEILQIGVLLCRTSVVAVTGRYVPSVSRLRCPWLVVLSCCHLISSTPQGGAKRLTPSFLTVWQCCCFVDTVVMCTLGGKPCTHAFVTPWRCGVAVWPCHMSVLSYLYLRGEAMRLTPTFITAWWCGVGVWPCDGCYDRGSTFSAFSTFSTFSD